jgi:hypothetical protein
MGLGKTAVYYVINAHSEEKRFAKGKSLLRHLIRSKTNGFDQTSSVRGAIEKEEIANW